MSNSTVLRETVADSSLLASLAERAPDGLLALIGQYRADPRPTKIDLGVGVYRNDEGATPVFRSVKEAERILIETQASKSYLGPEGDIRFVELLAPFLFGAERAGNPRLTGVQTPGGTGALRLGAELIVHARPGATIWFGDPTWANHAPVFRAAGLKIAHYASFDVGRQQFLFDSMLAALDQAASGDIVLLHGCCHNPTGADPSDAQWEALAERIGERGLIPFIDLAYQGLGRGMEEDARGLRLCLDRSAEALIAYSCDKNFGLYRERVGALWLWTPDEAVAKRACGNMLALARTSWSMPPDHGAAVVRTILESPALTADWRAELEEMRLRMLGLRNELAAAHPRLAPLSSQQGMFSLLPLDPTQVAALRRDHGIYMAGDGRINIAGLHRDTVSRFAAALAPYLGE